MKVANGITREEIKMISSLQGEVRLKNAPVKFEKVLAEEVKPETEFDQFNRAYVTIQGERLLATLKKGVSATKEFFTVEKHIAVRAFEVNGNKFPAGYPSVKFA